MKNMARRWKSWGTVRRVLYPTDYRHAFYQRGVPGTVPAAVRDHQLLAESDAPFRSAGAVAALAAYRAFPSTVGRALPMKGFWWQSPPYRCLRHWSISRFCVGMRRIATVCTNLYASMRRSS